MKKILFTTVALTGLVIQSFGQGEVIFVAGSSAATRVYVSSNGVASTDQSAGVAAGALAPANSTSPFMYALFSALPTVTTVTGNPWTDPAWSFSNNYGTNTAAGRLTGMGPYAATGSGGVVINGFAVGATASLLVIGWDVAHGGSTLASFEAAYGNGSIYTGLYGRAGVGNILLGNGSTTPDSLLFGTTAGQLGGFTMAGVVPEPATFALAGLGAAA